MTGPSKHIVDVSSITCFEWKDILSESYTHIVIRPIIGYTNLFVLENLSNEDVIALTLIGFIFKNDIFSYIDELMYITSPTIDFLCYTADGYRIIRMNYGKIISL